ncbi:O-antigen ligase family protein [Halorussus ruber]|uniref:O-antigen ligase family protein n=1 Tax=Halorussus ruber TaxID=1126238 RepID=UPI0010932108|nr:O-antigen ligase family protein [Halorussus ruber]
MSGTRLKRVACLFLYLFSGSLPFAGYGVETGVVTLSLTNVFLILTVLAVVGTVVIDREVTLGWQQATFIFTGSLLGLYTSLHSALGISTDIRHTITLLGCVVTAGSLLVLVDSRTILHRVLFSVSVGVAAFSVIGGLAAIGAINPVSKIIPPREIAGFVLPINRTLGGPLAFGSFGILLTTSVAYLAGLLSRSHDWKAKQVSILLLAACGIGLLTSQSRSTVLAIVVALGIHTIGIQYNSYSNPGRFVTIAVRLGAVTFGVLALPLASVLYRVRTTSVTKRFAQVADGIEIATANPVVGLGRYEYVTQTDGLVIHNTFVESAAATGVIGVTLIATLWGLAAQRSVRYVLRGRPVFYSIVVAAAVGGTFVENLFYLGLFAKPMWFILGLALTLSRLDGTEQQRQTDATQ